MPRKREGDTLKLEANERRIRKHAGSLVLTVPLALAADRRIGDGAVVRFTTMPTGFLLEPVAKEELERRRREQAESAEEQHG